MKFWHIALPVGVATAFGLHWYLRWKKEERQMLRLIQDTEHAADLAVQNAQKFSPGWTLEQAHDHHIACTIAKALWLTPTNMEGKRFNAFGLVPEYMNTATIDLVGRPVREVAARADAVTHTWPGKGDERPAVEHVEELLKCNATALSNAAYISLFGRDAELRSFYRALLSQPVNGQPLLDFSAESSEH